MANTFENLDTSSESAAVFFLPPDYDKVQGQIVYEPETGLSVTYADHIHNGYRHFEHHFNRGGVVESRVPGQLSDGRYFSLHNFSVTNCKFGSSGFADNCARASHVLIWSSTRAASPVMFDDITISLSSLNDWFAQPLIKSSPHNKNSKHATSIECLRHEPFSVGEHNGEARLFSDQNIRRNYGFHSANIESNYLIRISLSHLADWKKCLDWAVRAQNFLSLLFGAQAFIQELSFNHREAIEENSNDHQSHLLSKTARPLLTKKNQISSVLFPEPLVRNSLSAIWDSWVRDYSKYENAIQLYSSTELFHGQLLEFEYLSICQALETLHRNLFCGQYLPDNEYETIRLAATRAIEGCQGPEGLIDSLSSRLKYGNEWSLRNRLRDITKKLPDDVRNLIHPDISQLLNKVVDTRNYLTHYDNSLEASIFKNHEMIVAIQILRRLFLVTVVSQLGMGKETLVIALTNDYGHRPYRDYILN